MNIWGKKHSHAGSYIHAGSHSYTGPHNLASSIRDALRTPVVVDVSDRTAADSIAMIIAATGRACLRADQAESHFPNGSHSGLFRVDDELIASLNEPLSAGGSLELAELIGTVDAPVIAVRGVEGGAGTSSLALHLAVGIAVALEQDAIGVTLKDRDRYSVGQELLFGWEHVQGNKVPGVPGLEFSGTDSGHNSRTDSGGELREAAEPTREGAPRRVIVADCGRAELPDTAPADPEPTAPGPAETSSLEVCVARPTVAGVHNLKRILDQLADAGVAAVGVLRKEQDRAIPMALRQMLGTAAVEVWEHREAVAQESLTGFAGHAEPADLELAARILGHLENTQLGEAA